MKIIPKVDDSVWYCEQAQWNPAICSFSAESQLGTWWACYIRALHFQSKCFSWTPHMSDLDFNRCLHARFFVLCEFQSPLISGTHSTGKLSAMCFKLASPSDVRCSNSIWACFQCACLAKDEVRGCSCPPLMPRTGKTPVPGGTTSLWSLY